MFFVAKNNSHVSAKDVWTSIAQQLWAEMNVTFKSAQEVSKHDLKKLLNTNDEPPLLEFVRPNYCNDRLLLRFVHCNMFLRVLRA